MPDPVTARNGELRVVLFDVGGVLVELSGIQTMHTWLGNRLTDRQLWARWLLAVVGALLGGAAVGWAWPGPGGAPRLVALPAFVVSSNVAALLAAMGVLRGRRHATWEPTRRDALAANS